MSLSFHNHLKRYKDDIEKKSWAKIKNKTFIVFSTLEFLCVAAGE